jgi:RecA-family ATPase
MRLVLDARRFFSLRGTLYEDGSSGGIALADTEQLEEAVTKYKARLVVIDPLQSFLGDNVDAHRANETRSILDGIGRLAEKTGCAILIARHLSKGIGGNALHLEQLWHTMSNSGRIRPCSRQPGKVLQQMRRRPSRGLPARKVTVIICC